MTTFNELQIELEKYYVDRYSDMEFALIVKFLKERNVPPMVAYDKVTLEHSKTYKCLPDVALFRKALESVTSSILDVEALRAWDHVTKHVTYYRSIVFEDPRTTYAFESIGGLEGYCNGDVKYAKLMRSDFVKAFKAASALKDTLPTYMFHGCLDDSDSKAIYVGDEERIRIAMKSSAPSLSTISSGLRVAFDDADMSAITEEAANDRF